MLYLGAIVAANLLTATFGPIASIVNAFLFIGLDLSTRDAIHDSWHGKNLWIKMFLLISTGSLISWLLNYNAGRVAIASAISFLLSGLVDAMVYAILGKKTVFVRINGSNVFSGAVDSVVFPTIAFGGFSLIVTIAQFLAKVAGGLVWSVVLVRVNVVSDTKNY